MKYNLLPYLLNDVSKFRHQNSWHKANFRSFQLLGGLHVFEHVRKEVDVRIYGPHEVDMVPFWVRNCEVVIEHWKLFQHAQIVLKHKKKNMFKDSMNKMVLAKIGIKTARESNFDLRCSRALHGMTHAGRPLCTPRH